MAQASRKSEIGFGANLMRHLKYGLRESAFLLLVGVAVFVAMALLSYQPGDPAWTHTGSHDTVGNQGGVIGALLADVMLYFFGYVAFLLPVALLYLAWRLIQADGWYELDGEIVLFRTLGSGVALAAACGLAALLLTSAANSGSGGGGVIGLMVSEGLTRSFGMLGGSLFLLALFLAGFTLATGLSWIGVLELVGKAAFWLVETVVALSRRLTELWPARDRPTADVPAEEPPPPPARMVVAPKPAPASNSRDRVEPVMTDDDAAPVDMTSDDDIGWFNDDPTPKPPVPTPIRRAAPANRSSKTAPQPPVRVRQATTPAAPAAESPLPPLDLLDLMDTEDDGYPPEELETMSRQVEKLLRDFGVEVTVVAVEPGPVITRFELDPAPGVKVNQISNLTKDLARGLSVMSVRVVEVIPGKSYIGLEIPNQRRQIVYLGEILSTPAYRNSASPLTLALGKDIGGQPVIANLAKMPHLLVAGTTGSGKSVAINAMLLSLLYKATPDDVRLILIDPKMLELSVYEDIPHLLAPVVTDMKDAANALRWCVAEMERRYRLMAALKVRNIAGYNKQVRSAIEAGEPIPDPLHKPDQDLDPDAEPPILEPLPFIVVVIDELADMMMVVGKKVEELIARLAQKARASGIHLILATQRPSVDVITGLIKANIPTRIAFQVSSKVDSRTILDQMGAENLLGHGDMLYQPPSSGFLLRVHGAFVDDHEVNRVAEYLKQTGEPDYSEEILDEPVEVSAEVAAFIGGDGGDGIDPLYDQAVRIVTESRRASISGVQRRLKIGYNRAARMIEEMEGAGIVSPLQSNGGREVLAPPPPDA